MTAATDVRPIVPASLACQDWCGEHAGGGAEDPALQICFSTASTLDFGEREAGGVEDVAMYLSYCHRYSGDPCEVPAVYLDVNIDRSTTLRLDPDQIEPLALALLAQLALLRVDAPAVTA